MTVISSISEKNETDEIPELVPQISILKEINK